MENLDNATLATVLCTGCYLSHSVDLPECPFCAEVSSVTSDSSLPPGTAVQTDPLDPIAMYILNIPIFTSVLIGTSSNKWSENSNSLDSSESKVTQKLEAPNYMPILKDVIDSDESSPVNIIDLSKLLMVPTQTKKRGVGRHKRSKNRRPRFTKKKKRIEEERIVE